MAKTKPVAKKTTTTKKPVAKKTTAQRAKPIAQAKAKPKTAKAKPKTTKAKPKTATKAKPTAKTTAAKLPPLPNLSTRRPDQSPRNTAGLDRHTIRIL